MIALLGASTLMLAALQASITAPTSAFRDCLHDAADKATGEKVSGDTIETYLRSACTVQMGTLKDALVAFRVKNGMSKKAAADDAHAMPGGVRRESCALARFFVERCLQGMRI